MIISIASGKGGTGKTFVATSLAIALSSNQKVQLLDCDVEEPNDHIFLKPVFTNTETASIPVPMIDEKKCTHCGKCSEVCVYNALAVLKTVVMTFHELCHGCGACAYLCPEKAITEMPRAIGTIEMGTSNGMEFVKGTLNVGEAMAPPVIRQVKQHINTDGISIIDASPGTSCPVIEAIKGSDFCLLVTDPTPFGLNDLTLAVETVRLLKIPCGVIINRSGSSDEQVEDYCNRENIPILMKIPLDIEFARLYSQGIPFVLGKPAWREYFVDLFTKIRQEVDDGK
ncbi:MAG: ATP-binding protein [Chloroflexota bacterium]|nr:ATP-binding protein [Chloroflexota bacterium]